MHFNCVGFHNCESENCVAIADVNWWSEVVHAYDTDIDDCYGGLRIWYWFVSEISQVKGCLVRAA